MQKCLTPKTFMNIISFKQFNIAQKLFKTFCIITTSLPLPRHNKIKKKRNDDKAR